MRMLDKNPDAWAAVIVWFYTHSNELTYAGIAGLVALMRACWTQRDRWRRRILDASICSVFAFNLQPAVEIFAGVLRDKYPVLDTVINEKSIVALAVFLGFLGTDFISSFLNKKLGGRNDSQ